MGCDVDNANTMSTPSVSIAAKKLSILLQQNGNMAHQPDPFTAQILNTWLETHLPVSDSRRRCRIVRLCGPVWSAHMYNTTHTHISHNVHY